MQTQEDIQKTIEGFGVQSQGRKSVGAVAVERNFSKAMNGNDVQSNHTVLSISNQKNEILDIMDNLCKGDYSSPMASHMIKFEGSGEMTQDAITLLMENVKLSN
jgi:hypothetical protein